MNKKLDKFLLIIENYFGYLIGIITFIFCFTKLKPIYKDFEEILDNYTNIAFGIFGFILTLLGIILQGSGKTIEYIKSNEDMYSKFIKMNKHVVLLSFLTGCLSFSLKFLSIYEFKSYQVFFENLLISILISLVSVLIFRTIYFIWIFYLLISNK